MESGTVAWWLLRCNGTKDGAVRVAGGGSNKAIAHLRASAVARKEPRKKLLHLQYDP